MYGKNNLYDQKSNRIMIKENHPIEGKDVDAQMCRKIYS